MPRTKGGQKAGSSKQADAEDDGYQSEEDIANDKAPHEDGRRQHKDRKQDESGKVKGVGQEQSLPMVGGKGKQREMANLVGVSCCEESQGELVPMVRGKGKQRKMANLVGVGRREESQGESVPMVGGKGKQREMANPVGVSCHEESQGELVLTTRAKVGQLPALQESRINQEAGMPHTVASNTPRVVNPMGQGPSEMEGLTGGEMGLPIVYKGRSKPPLIKYEPPIYREQGGGVPKGVIKSALKKSWDDRDDRGSAVVEDSAPSARRIRAENASEITAAAESSSHIVTPTKKKHSAAYIPAFLSTTLCPSASQSESTSTDRSPSSPEFMC
ncbi:hypothetical protein OG21DRAFT_1528303 [Imleria badia]|nr:hypothetical protein OG21DRAFT_1528303 [Imleria badia]